MKLPDKITIKNTAHGSGDKGLAFYTYEDGEGLGIVMDARRTDDRSPFVESWRFRWLPNLVFVSFAHLVEVLRALPDEAVEAEKAKWPVLEYVVERGPESLGSGRCWLHTDRPATHRAYALTCWIRSAGTTALLCEECATDAAKDASVVIRASEKRVADVAARKEDRRE